MLEINNLRIAYRHLTVIPGLTLRPLRAGRLVALLGPNGSGKSTLLKAVAGLLPPQHGAIRLDEEELRGFSLEQRAQRVVYLPQSLPASVHLRVLESVLVAARASRLPAVAGLIEPDQVLALLERLGIGHLAMRYLDQLSGGQKQLVGLAQALIRRPRLLLLDEPLSALDLNYQFHVLDLLAQETRERNLITVIVLHDLNVALGHCDDAVLIKRGQLLGEGACRHVITPTALAKGYGVAARVEACTHGRLQVLIDGLLAPVD